MLFDDFRMYSEGLLEPAVGTHPLAKPQGYGFWAESSQDPGIQWERLRVSRRQPALIVANRYGLVHQKRCKSLP
jgi:hypothetical protein